MKAFVSQRMSGEEELRSRLEQAEANLSAVPGRQRGSPDRASRGEEPGGSYRSPPARGRGRDGPAKGGKDLQLRLSAQKEELEAEFAAKGGTRDEYRAVDEMYFFGYRCCMKKNGIKRDVPSISPGEEENEHRPLLIVGHPDGCALFRRNDYVHTLCEAKECFLSDVRVWFDKPTGRRVAPPPTSLWLARASSLRQLLGSCLWPLLAHCFEDNAVWSMNSGCLVPNRNSGKRCYQTVDRCQL
ncbi:hypothetical protein AAG906_000634 [Vitis piasezkii]